MLYRSTKLNDFVSFIRFALNGSPPYKPYDQLTDFVFSTSAQAFKMYFCGLEHIADRWTEPFHATEMLLIRQTSNLAVSSTLKTKAVTECDLLNLAPPPSPI